MYKSISASSGPVIIVTQIEYDLVNMACCGFIDTQTKSITPLYV